MNTQNTGIKPDAPEMFNTYIVLMTDTVYRKCDWFEYGIVGYCLWGFKLGVFWGLRTNTQ
jgi:hypothetical protein